MASTQSELKALFDRRSEASRLKDIDRLCPSIRPTLSISTLCRRLQYVGSAALRERFLDWFARFDGPIGQEIQRRDDCGEWGCRGRLYADPRQRHPDERARGRLLGPGDNGCQRSSDGWLITHEHVSLPVDIASGRAVMDLVP